MATITAIFVSKRLQQASVVLLSLFAALFVLALAS